MGAKGFWLLAIAVILAAGGWVWVLTRPLPEPPLVITTPTGRPTGSVTRPPGAPPPPAERAIVTPPPPAVAAAPTEPPLPLPVDLDEADRDLDLFGIVVDDTDGPVAGCKMETLLTSWEADWFLHPDSYHHREAGPGTRSAEDGTFSIRLERGQVVDLRATAPEYAVTVLPNRVAGERVKVVLPEACKVEVSVKDLEEKPQQGVEIHLWLHYGSPLQGLLDEGREGMTDGDGFCLFDSLHPAAGWLTIDEGGRGTALKEVEVKTGETLRVEVTLEAGWKIRGRVADAKTGQPIAGARVGDARPSATDAFTLTDSDGHYEWSVGMEQSGMLSASAEGYGREIKMVIPDEASDFELARGSRVVGRVVDESGDPIPGADVSAMGNTREGEMKRYDAVVDTTGEDGSFSLEGLRGDLSYRLTLRKRGRGTHSLPIDISAAVNRLLDLGDIPLLGPRRLEGHAVSAEGQPIRNGSVRLRRDDPDRRLSFDPFGGSPTSRLDDLGRFRFHDLAPGEYWLVLQAQGVSEVRKGVTLPPDADLLDVELRVKGGTTLRIRVESRSGNPVRGILLYAQPLGGFQDPSEVMNATTDENGMAILRGLPGRSILLSAHGQGKYLTPDPIRVVPSGQDVKFVVDEAAQIKGIALKPDGKPLFGISVIGTVQGAEPESLFGFTMPDGSFTLPCEAGDVVDILVAGTPRSFMGDTPKGQPFYEGEVRGVVAPSEEVKVQTRQSEMDRTLTMRVLDPDGEPLPAITLMVHGVGIIVESASQRATDEDGRVLLEELPPTELTIRASLPSDSPLRRNSFPNSSVSVVPAGQEVALQFMRGIPMSGVVVDVDSVPVPGAFVSAGPEQALVANQLTDQEGKFHLVLPTRGPFRIQAQRTLQDGSVESTVLDGVTAEGEEVVLRLGPE